MICRDTDTYITTALLPVAFITVICKDTDTDTYITTALLPFITVICKDTDTDTDTDTDDLNETYLLLAPGLTKV